METLTIIASNVFLSGIADQIEIFLVLKMLIRQGYDKVIRFLIMRCQIELTDMSKMTVCIIFLADEAYWLGQKLFSIDALSEKYKDFFSTFLLYSLRRRKENLENIKHDKTFLAFNNIH